MSRGISYLKKSVISRGILGGWSTIPFLWGSPAKFQRDETAGKLICSLTKSFDTPEIAVNCPVRSESFESCRSLSNRCFRWSHRRRVNTFQFRVLSTIRSDLTILVDTDLPRRKHGLSKAIILIAFQISRSIRKFSSTIFSRSWGIVSSQNVITHRNVRKSSCSNYVDKIRFPIMLTSIQAPLGIPPFNDSTILRSLLVNAFRKDVSFQGFCDLLWLYSWIVASVLLAKDFRILCYIRAGFYLKGQNN